MRRIAYLFPVLVVILLLSFVSCNFTANKETMNDESIEFTCSDENCNTETATIISSTETVTIETSVIGETETSETQKTTIYVEYWDHMMWDQPSEKEIQMVHKGMTFFEVIDIIGMPHMLNPDDSSFIGYGRVWVTTNGNSYCLSFSLDKHVCVDNIDSETELYSHLILDEDPYIVKTRFKSECSSKIVSYVINGVDYYQLHKHSDYYITEPNTSARFADAVYKITDGQPVDVTDECIFYDDFFDWKFEHQPTIEEIGLIHEGMTYPEVEAIIGKPHRYDPNNPTLYIWVTSEGNDYALYFWSTTPFTPYCMYRYYRYSDFASTTFMFNNSRFHNGIMRVKTQFCTSENGYKLPFSSLSDAHFIIDGVSYYQIDKHLNYYLTIPSTIVDEKCIVYRIIDGKPVDVTNDCDWSGTINSYWYYDWHVNNP